VPRRPIAIPQRVEWLSILDAEGQVDRALEPQIPPTDLRRLYKTLIAARRLDERAMALQSQGRLGTFAPNRGQEAASLGVAFALETRDWLVPSFRELAASLWRGWGMAKTFFYWGGFECGSVAPDGVNDLPICVPVATQVQNAVGIAWGLKLRKTDAVCATFIGDGGTSEGDFHEALNWACVFAAPLVMVVQNNQWAISLPRSRQTISPTIAQKAIAYGCDALQVDGNDLLAMIVATREAVARARAGGGPTLIEAVTYRLGVHTTADDPRKYRSEKEVKEWEARDPLPRFRNYLVARDLLDARIEQEIDDEVREELAAALREYEAYRLEPYAFFHHMYAELTPDLRAQMAELRTYMGEGQPPAATPAATPPTTAPAPPTAQNKPAAAPGKPSVPPTTPSRTGS
jgi:pyruvate dehydrogenase E1 component alpha subunit